MADSVFRTADTKVEISESVPEGIPATSGGEIQAEVPYLDYERSSGHPYIADHYQIGDTWAEPNGGFPKEIENIEGYISEQIKSGEIANSADDVKTMLKKMEKLNNIDKESRSVVKLEILSHYIDFLRQTDQTRKNLRRYG